MTRPTSFYSIDRQKLQDLVLAECEFYADPNLRYMDDGEEAPEGEPGPFLWPDSYRERDSRFFFAVVDVLGIQFDTLYNAPDEVQDALNWPDQGVGLQSPEEITTEVITALMTWAVTLPKIEWIW